MTDIDKQFWMNGLKSVLWTGIICIVVFTLSKVLKPSQDTSMLLFYPDKYIEYKYYEMENKQLEKVDNSLDSLLVHLDKLNKTLSKLK